MRGVDPELVFYVLPVLHTLVPDDLEFITTPLDWRGRRRSTNRKKHLLLIFKSHANVCEWTGVSRVVIAGKELAQR